MVTTKHCCWGECNSDCMLFPVCLFDLVTSHPRSAIGLWCQLKSSYRRVLQASKVALFTFNFCLPTSTLQCNFEAVLALTLLQTFRNHQTFLVNDFITSFRNFFLYNCLFLCWWGVLAEAISPREKTKLRENLSISFRSQTTQAGMITIREFWGKPRIFLFINTQTEFPVHLLKIASVTKHPNTLAVVWATCGLNSVSITDSVCCVCIVTRYAGGYEGRSHSTVGRRNGRSSGTTQRHHIEGQWTWLSICGQQTSRSSGPPS